jgi:UDP-glucose 4-epimerase
MKIAILGASSFIGRALATRFVEDGHQVSAFVRTVDLRYGDTLGLQVEFDFQNRLSWSSGFLEFDAIIHLVSTSNPGSSKHNARVDTESNLLGTLDLLQVLETSKNKRLIFASSGGAVYGPPRSVPVNEGHATDPVSPYGVSKLAIEKYLHIARLEFGLDYTIFRLANPYGPGQENTKGQGLISTVIENALRGQSVTVWGNGSIIRDYVYIDDVVEAFVQSLSYEGGERIMNLGSGKGVSVLEIVSEVEDLVGQKITIDFKPGRAIDPLINVLDISLAKRELLWDPKTTLREGISTAIEWKKDLLGK